MSVSINDVRDVLRSNDGWFEPDMESNQYILDIRLTYYPYIVVRYITGISKNDTKVNDGKVFAVNLMTRSGWLKSTTVRYYDNWRMHLIKMCRSYWIRSVDRAKNKNLDRIYIDDYVREQHALGLERHFV